MLLLKASLFQQSCSAFCTCTPFFYLAKSCISPEKYVRALVTCMEISVPFHFSHNGLNFGPVSPRILTSPVSIVVYSPNSHFNYLCSLTSIILESAVQSEVACEGEQQCLVTKMTVYCTPTRKPYQNEKAFSTSVFTHQGLMRLH